MPAATLVAPAKLTVSLRVVGTRPDGYHLIDAEMVTLDLADTLTLEELPAATPGEAGADPIEVRTGADRHVIPVDGDNLVARALRQVGRRARVVLDKRIPPGAGLGGGSADAAAILRWAGVDDLDVAAAIGADVPFCVVGGRARVRGIGEVVDRLEPIDRVFTLLTPPFGCSTVEVYRMWDRLAAAGAAGAADGDGADGAAGVRHAEVGPAGVGGPPAPPNDLEAAALAVEPRLAEARDRLAAHTGQRPRLAGSGSTWFVEGEFPGDGLVIARTTRGA